MAHLPLNTNSSYSLSSQRITLLNYATDQHMLKKKKDTLTVDCCLCDVLSMLLTTPQARIIKTTSKMSTDKT